MSWIEKVPGGSRLLRDNVRRKSVPEGLWTKCESCNAVLYRAELERTLEVCPKCGHHRAIEARARLNAFLDEDPREEIASGLRSADPLHFKDTRKYTERVVEAREETRENDALIVIRGRVMGLPVVASAFEFNFMGGSMGSVVGEKFVAGVNAALEHGCPLVTFCASGGARMQESLFSLMQMAKTSAALTKLSERGLPYVSVLTHPTMGGVSASFAAPMSTIQCSFSRSGYSVPISSNTLWKRPSVIFMMLSFMKQVTFLRLWLLAYSKA